MKITLLFVTLIGLSASFAQAEEFDLGVESEFAMVDSESALAAEDEARRRAEDERLRAAQEKEIAKREEAKARQQEAAAKAQIAKWQQEEKLKKAERKAAEIRKMKAQAILAKIENDLMAKEAELTALTQVTEQTVADRDKYEAAIEKTNDRIAQVQIKMKQMQERRAKAEADKMRLTKKLTERRAVLKAMVRRPAANRPIQQQTGQPALRPTEAQAPATTVAN